jgi:transposase
MYIDDQKYSRNGKNYRRVLLRQGRRVKGKIVLKTVANLSHCSDQEISALKLAMQMKDDLEEFKKIAKGEFEYGKKVGAVSALFQVADRLGIRKALGNGREGNLALWLVIARLIDQGSRLSAVRLAQDHAACETLGLDSFNEDDLYESLNWLYENREKIEQKLFEGKNKAGSAEGLFLYDLSSSYLEGEKNQLAAYGYNRDGRKGKLQINYGLLTDEDGDPVSIQGFRGNTNDNKTVGEQIEKLKGIFGCRHITFVGDKGTIKTLQIGEIQEAGFNYITSITKDQIRTLLNNGNIQLEFFDAKVCEIEDIQEKVRYILRKNPERAKKIEENRQSKINKLTKELESANEYLSRHARAKVSTQVKIMSERAEKLRFGKYVKIEPDENSGLIRLTLNDEVLKRDRELDGCYVIKTDLPKEAASCQVVHDRYKDLSLVEKSFRTCKTGHLEIRPVFLRDAERTQAHLLVTMMAYKIERHLRESWKDLNLTVEEGIQNLGGIVSVVLTVGETRVIRVGKPNSICKSLLKNLQAALPAALPSQDVKVNTRKSLPKNRKSP